MKSLCRPFHLFAARLHRWVAPAVCLLLPAAALANRGLVPEGSEWLWPQLQARITLQTAAIGQGALFPWTGTPRWADAPGSAARGVRGGAVFGDYVIASPAFGNFRATSGVVLGAQGGAPAWGSQPFSRLSVSVLESAAAAGSETNSALPYLGLGFSTPAMWRSFFISADLGVVAARPAGFSGLGRAVLGNQPMDAAMRELRLAPLVQFGMRYSF